MMSMQNDFNCCGGATEAGAKYENCSFFAHYVAPPGLVDRRREHVHSHFCRHQRMSPVTDRNTASVANTSFTHFHSDQKIVPM
jgi:hypothetical protein